MTDTVLRPDRPGVHGSDTANGAGAAGNSHGPYTLKFRIVTELDIKNPRFPLSALMFSPVTLCPFPSKMPEKPGSGVQVSGRAISAVR